MPADPSEFWTLNGSLAGFVHGVGLVPQVEDGHYVAGVVGNGWALNGTFENFQSNALLSGGSFPSNPATGYTMSFWFRASALVEVSLRTLVYWGRVEVGTYRLGEVLYSCSPGVGQWLTVSIGSETFDPMLLGVDSLSWHHIGLTVVSEGPAASVSVDGIASGLGLTTFPGGGGALGTLVGVGCRDGYANAGIDDLEVDSIGFWSSALGSEDLGSVYNSGGGWEPSLSGLMAAIAGAKGGLWYRRLLGWRV